MHAWANVLGHKFGIDDGAKDRFVGLSSGPKRLLTLICGTLGYFNVVSLPQLAHMVNGEAKMSARLQQA